MSTDSIARFPHGLVLGSLVCLVALHPPLLPSPAAAEEAATPAAIIAVTPKKDAPKTDVIEVVDSILPVGRVVGSAHAVDEKELEELNYDDPERVLSQVPGVYLRGEDGFGLRPNIGLRGAAPDRSSKVTLMEDGILFAPAPYSAPAAYFFPLSSLLYGVEVYKGPASIQFGPQTIGGAINVLTRPIPEQEEGELSLDAGMYRFSRLQARWGRSVGHFGVLLEGARLQTTGFKQLDGGGDTGFDKLELRAKAQWHSEHWHSDEWHSEVSAAPRQRLELKLGFADERSNETYLGLSDEDFATSPHRRYAASQLDRMTWQRTQLHLSHQLRPMNGLELRTTVYRHDFDRVWRKLNGFRSGPALADILANPDAGQQAVYMAILRGELDSEDPAQTLLIGTNDRRFVSQGLQLQGQYESGNAHFYQRLELGARLHHDQIQRLHTEEGYLMRTGVLVPEVGDPATTAQNVGETLALAVHGLEQLYLGPWLFTPGVRIEHITTYFDDALAGTEQTETDPVVLPGLGVLYAKGEWLELFAGVHRGFSPVTPGQAAEIKPELSINYEAGTRLRVGGAVGEVVGFFNDYSNLTGQCTLSSGCLEDSLDDQFQAGRVRVLGLELAAGQRVSLPGGGAVEGRASYTWTHSSFLTSFRSDNPHFGTVEVGDELPFVPVHQGAGRLSVERGRASLEVAVAGVGQIREAPGQGEIAEDVRIPGHLVIDLAARWAFTPMQFLQLKVDNLSNANYLSSRLPYGARSGKPFWVQLGYTHRFGG